MQVKVMPELVVHDISMHDLIALAHADPRNFLRLPDKVGVVFTEMSSLGWLNVLLVAPIGCVLVDPWNVRYDSFEGSWLDWLAENFWERKYKRKLWRHFNDLGVDVAKVPAALFHCDYAYKKIRLKGGVGANQWLDSNTHSSIAIPRVAEAQLRTLSWLKTSLLERGDFFCKPEPETTQPSQFSGVDLYSVDDHLYSLLFGLTLFTRDDNDLAHAQHRALQLLESHVSESGSTLGWNDISITFLPESVRVLSSSAMVSEKQALALRISSFRARLMNQLAWPVFYAEALKILNNKRGRNEVSQGIHFGIDVAPFDLETELHQLVGKIESQYPSYRDHPFDDFVKQIKG